MNDRYKFRAWDKTENAYIEDAQFTYDDGCEGGMGSFRHYSFRDLLEDKNCIVEQCTGLKDKNGKLIYEGDIVREISKKEPEWEEYIITVEWKGCGFNLYRDDEFDFLVIGNIHENSELLEKDNAESV